MGNFVNESTKRACSDPDRYFPEDWEAIDQAACIIWANLPNAVTRGAAVRIASKVYDGVRQLQADQRRREFAKP